MLALNWLARFVHAFTRRFTPRKNRSRFRWDSMDKLHTLRLRLEGLEDRTVPALFTVLNTNDTGAGSLRDAVAQANANVGADTIVFGDGSGSGGANFLDATPDTITLTTGPITFTDTATTTVTGPGANLLSVSGNNASRVFFMNASVSAALSGLTITGGHAPSFPGGGGVFISTGGTTTLTNCDIVGNSGFFGGGLTNRGSVTLNGCTLATNTATSGAGGGLYQQAGASTTMLNCTISGNTGVGAGGDGGGVYSGGSFTASGSTFTGNTNTTRGGAIGAFAGVTTLTNCTVSGNSAPNGAGVQCDGSASLQLINCTLSGNSATGSGAGVNLGTTGTATLTNCTVSGNTAATGGGVRRSAGTLNIGNTILAGNTATTSGPDASGIVVSQGNNLIGKTDGSSGWVGSDLTGTVAAPLNPQLAALAGNGGPTQTMAPLFNSPAINAGNAANAPANDQRGLPRFGNTDIGAFEYQFKVANTADSGVGSLRQAVLSANSATTPDTIIFTSLFNTPRTITLTTGQLTLTDSAATTISGPGASLLSVSGNNANRVFGIGSGASAALSGLTITGGTTGSFGGGGLANSGTVSLSNAIISGNTAVNGFWGGGGLFNYASGTATLTNVTVSGNSTPTNAMKGGGGLFNLGTMAVTSSTISGNTSSGGGGIGNHYAGTLTLTNVTVSGNTGGGVGSDGGNSGGVGMAVTLTNVTVSGNTGGVSGVRGGTTTLTNTIIASNGTDLSFSINAAFSSLGNNLIGNRGSTTGWLASDLTGTAASPLDAQLGALASNGGPTQTMALLFNSPAIGAGNAANAPANDQRGQTRFGGTDIGAYEYLFKVTNTTDTAGLGSLRQAMLNANATAGTDTIVFRIGSGAQTISPLAALPTITETIAIDGTTQPGYVASALIQIEGTSAGNNSGLTLAGGSSGSTIKGLILSNFNAAGASGISIASNNNVVQGNWIGTNPSGTAAAANRRGISITGTGNLVGGTAAGAGNTVAFNTDGGVVIDGAAGNALRLNRIYANTGGQIRLLNGANQSQPAPLLSAVLGGSSTRVFGVLTGVAPNTAYAVDLFSSATPGEARTVLGTATVTSNALGTAAFDITVTGTAPFGDQVTASATRLATGDTSGLDAGQPAAGAIIAGVPLTLAEGTPVTLTAFTAADPGGGQALAYNWAVTKNGSPFAASVEASITFTPDNQGTYVVTLLVTNSTGSSAVVGPVTLNATNAPPAPQIFGAPSAAQVGTPISLHGVGNDPGTADAVTYAWQVRDTSATGALLFSGTGPGFAFTPVTGGLYQVALTADDHDGGIATTSQAIIVSGGSVLATITAPAISDEGTPVRALAAVSNLIRTDTLDYQWTVQKAGVPYPFTRLDEGGITFTPDDNALYTIGLTVLSGGAAFTAAPAVVDVRNVNPQADIVGAPATASAGVPVTVTGAASDRGAADTATFQWSVVGPVAVPGGTGPQFTFTPTAAGDYVLKLTVRDDDGGSTTTATAIRVNATGLAVQITGAPASGPEGTAIALGSAVANPNGATFRYDWAVTRNGDPFRTLSSATPANPTGFTAVPLPLTLLPDDDGNYAVTLTVTASDGRVGSATKAVTVTNVNPTAAIGGGTGTLFEGGPVTLTAVASDPGAADELSYEWRVNGLLRPNDAADPARFVFTPPDNGPFVVDLTVRDDDGGFATASKTLTVLNVAPAAIIASDPATTAADGSAVGLAAVVTDPGTADTTPNTFTYGWTARRNGATIATLSGAGPAFSKFSYSTAGGGTFVATLSVTDKDGGSAPVVTTLSIVGGAANDAIAITPAVIAAAGPGVTQVLVQGLGGNDTITTDPAVLLPVVLDGGSGDDLLQGGGGGDLLVAGPGNNTLSGGAGNDTLRGGGNDDISGGFGDDYYRVHFSTVQLFESGSGTDTIDLTEAPQGVTFNLSIQDGSAQPVFSGSTLAVTGSFEQVVGSDYGDKLTTGTSSTTLFGGLGDDTLAVAAGADITVFGGAGDDTFDVLGGDHVTVFGGEGADSVAVLGGDAVTVFGDDGDDTISVGGTSSEVTVFGGVGDDSVAVAAGADVTVFGAEGNDSVSVLGGDAVTVFGGVGDDTLAVTGGTDVTVFGGEGADAISVGGAAAEVTVFGGDGNDSLAVTGGDAVTVFGDGGDDTISVAAGADITVFGGEGNDSVAVLGGDQVTVFGAEGDDVLSVGGDAAHVTVFGDGGDDSVTVAVGTDVTVFGGEGNDTLAVLGGDAVTVFGGDGNDSVAVAAGTDVTVFGGVGDDSVTVTGELVPGAGGVPVTTTDRVTVFGGEGDDTLSVGGAAAEVTVFGGDGNDSLAVTGGDAVTVFGDGGDDTISIGGASSEVTVFGGDGNDSLAVTGGDAVTVFGGEGNDSVAVAAGTDVTVFGGVGDDTLAVTGGAEVTVFGGEGNDSLAVTGGDAVTVFGGEGNDSLAVTGGNAVTVFGGVGDDSVAVSAGADVTVFGAEGNDSVAVTGGDSVTVFGGDGNDTLSVTATDGVTVFGGEGNDSVAVVSGTDVTVFGGVGDDTLAVTGGAEVTVFGGDGNDTLSVGGTASDITVFGGAGDDSVAVSSGAEVTVFGGVGDDTLAVTGGTDVTVFGNEGNDTLTVAGGDAVTVFGGDGNDSVAVTGGAEVTVFGDGGDDTLTVAGGTDVTVFGDGGDDTLTVAGGAEVTVFGGVGDDTLTVAGGTDVTVFGGLGNDALGAAAGTGVKLYGEAGNDALAVTGGLNLTVSGGTGDDTLSASGGAGVVLLGGTGTDLLTATGAGGVTLSGGAGDDTLAAEQAGGVYLFGDDGNDTYRFGATGAQSVRVKEILILDVTTFEAPTAGTSDPTKGGEAESHGSDTLDLSAYTGAVVSLAVFGSEADALVGAQLVTAGFTLTIFGTVENLVGTAGNDTLTGNAAANRLDGGGGSDWVDGQGGDDTLTGGTGDDTLLGGAGNDTYVFTGSGVGADTVTEAANADSDTLDFAQLAAPLALSLAGTGLQAFTTTTDAVGGPALALTLSDGAGIENVVGTAYSDAITGNARDNVLEGGAGDDTLAGGAGSDTYVFAGSGLGADRVVEAAGADSDTLDFAQFDAPLALDLAATGTQAFGGPGQSLTLPDADGVENVVGTVYADTLRGNGRGNALYGSGGADYLEGRGGNDNLQGDLAQVVLLDFDSATSPSSGDHVYTADERAAVIARLRAVFGPFNYVFTTDPAQAAALTAHSGREFVTLVFNDGAGGGIGGESNELDFGNRVRGTRATVNVSSLLGGTGQPAATSANLVGLTVTITAHELAHMAGLLHADAFGPIGTGVYAGADPTRYLPAYTGAAGAAETPHHIMASPLSLNTTLFDAVGLTVFGEREAVKLAFNETGAVRVELATTPGSHETFATAEPLGVLPGLAVPNTLLPGDRDYGKTFDVSAVSVVGTIQLVGGRSENDVYSFTGKSGDVMNLSVASRNLIPPRGNPIDGVLKLYGSSGQLLAVNDDTPESTDPVILDFVLPMDGLYYVVVDTYAAAQDVDVGRYELFLYRFATTTGAPAANLGDTVLGGAGSDTLIGSAADDTFRATGSISGDHDAYFGKAGFDTLDITGYPLLQYTADGVDLVVGQNQAPTLAPPAAVEVAQGAPVTVTPVASDPDTLDRLTFTLSPTGNPIDLFPAGATVDPRTGTVTWVAGRPGTYAALLTVTDAAGVAVSQPISIQVTNVAPAAAVGGNATLAEGGSLTRSGSFTDPGADAWAATVNYGDGTGPQPLALNPDRTFTLSHAYADNGTYTVAVVVNDGFASSSPASFTVVVTDVAPTATLSSPGPVNEGGTATVSFANPSDVSSADATAGFRYSFALSSGALVGTYAAASAAPSAAFPFPASGTYTVYGRVFDKDDGFTDYATAVVVANVAPAVAATVSPGPTVYAGTPLSFSGSFIDPGNDVAAAGLSWVVVSSNGQVVSFGGGASFAFTPTDGTYTVQFKATDADGADGVTLLQITALHVPPAGVLANSGPVAEGGTATVTLTPTNVPPADAAALRYAYDFDNDGTFDLGTGTYLGSVAENAAVVPASYLADGPFDRVVRVRVIDATGSYTDTTTTITVTDVAPTAGVSGPAVVGAGQSATFTLTASDPSPVDQAAAFTFRIDWDGDGAADEVVTGPSGMTVTHAFPAGGNYTVRVVAVDKDGVAGPAATVAVRVDQVFVQDGDLYVYGTAGNDTIQVTQSGSAVVVTIGGASFGTFNPTGVIRVFAGDGNDRVALDSTVALSAVIHGDGGNDTLHGGAGNDTVDGGAGDDSVTAISGNDSLLGGDGNDALSGGAGNDALSGGAGGDSLNGGSGNDTLVGAAGDDTLLGSSGDDFMDGGSGNDHLDGGSGADVLLGGDGADVLIGGSGHDLMIGGFGADALVGNAADDILIGGTTAHDTDPAALAQILGVWNANSTYQARVGALQAPDFAYRLSPGQTVFDDGAVDQLTGSAGQDWFFANVDGTGARDQIIDLGGNETDTDTDG